MKHCPVTSVLVFVLLSICGADTFSQVAEHSGELPSRFIEPPRSPCPPRKEMIQRDSGDHSDVIFLALFVPLAVHPDSAIVLTQHSASAEERRIPDVMYIPTPPDVVQEMLKLAQVGKDDVVYDLGCGDGRIVVAAAKQFGCRAVGVDIDPLRVAAARQRVRDNHVEHLVRIEQANLFDVPLADATVITLYLSTKYNTRLIPQLNQAKPGTRIVSHLFEIKGIKADKSVEVTSRFRSTPASAPTLDDAAARRRGQERFNG